MSQQQIVFYTVINPLPGNNSFSNKPRYCHKTIISPIYCPKGPFIFPKKSFVFPISALSKQCYVMTVAGNFECHKVTISFLIVPQAIIRKFGLHNLKFLY